MNCPQCKQRVDTAGVVTVAGAELVVYQCDHCVVPWQVGDSTFQTALTFAVSADGTFLDPETGVAISLN